MVDRDIEATVRRGVKNGKRSKISVAVWRCFFGAFLKIREELGLAAQWYGVGAYGVGVDEPGLAGDFDGDGDVDGTDFLVWQQGFGSAYDANDLADWENNYGTSLPVAAAAVPEPATGGMLMLGMVAILLRRCGCQWSNCPNVWMVAIMPGTTSGRCIFACSRRRRTFHAYSLWS